MAYPFAQNTFDVKNCQDQIAQYQALGQGIIHQISPEAIHSGKDYRGIFDNPAAILGQLSGDIPLGYYGYGASIPNPTSELDVRQYRYLVSQDLGELLKGHIRLVGPSRAGKSEFMFKLVVNLAKNYNFSIIWFSTKWQDDKDFFEAIFPDHTVISANEIPLTRLTKGRFNPLNRIPIRDGRVNPQDCRKLAATLINLIPIQDVSGDTEKFMRDAVVRFAAILELLKYEYAGEVTLEQVLPLWVILPQGDESSHPLETLLNSPKVPPEAKQRLRRNLLPLLQRQPAHEAMVGPTAQQLLSEIESLASVMAADDLPNFSSRLRQSNDLQVLVIDQSDGLNSSMSKGLARLLFPLLYEDLVVQCPANWKDVGMRPVLMVGDEMNSLLGGKGEFADFLEKSLSKGVLLAFGQQSSAGNPDPRLNAAMSNNTRLQIVFSGCDATDPVVEEMSAVAGNFLSPLEPHRVEEGFGNLPRLPVDSVTALGPLASLVRVKSTTSVDRILWVYQGNPLVPHRSSLLKLRHQLAVAIATAPADGELLHLYEQTEILLLRSYGYWSQQELKVGYASLNLSAIAQAYQSTMEAVAFEARQRREAMQLDRSRPDFTRSEVVNLSKTLIEWQQQQACTVEAWLWNSFFQDVLPELQWFEGRHLWADAPIKQPRLGFWRSSPLNKKRFLFWSWGEDFPTRVALHWQEILLEYQRYTEAFGRENPSLWHNGVSALVNWRVGQTSGFVPQSHRKLGGLARWLSGQQ
ncbi:hypothetical protein [Nostoc sp. C110]|uniref:hypothetical protein n=1 Tax=Nostoc sp. C110 TaxID=3349876 RepID=UPI00370DC758